MKNSVVLIAVVIAYLSASMTYGQTRMSGSKKPVLWKGTVSKGVGPLSEIAECSIGCQRFDLTVDLPADVWKNKPGGLQIAIRWRGYINAMGPTANLTRAATAENLGDNLKLYIYRNSSLIAAADGTTSLAQSVLIPEAPNGIYRVYVVFDTDSPSSNIPYEGLAEVEYRPRRHPIRRLLPDLEARPQRNVTFDPGRIFGAAISSSSPSCYYTEVEEEGARTCLRFDQVFANVGEGPLEVRFKVPHGSTATTHPAYQRVYWSDASAHFDDRPTSQVELHREHAHYHVMTFAVSRLWGVSGTAHPKRPRGLKLFRTGRKVSFCMVDTEIDAWAEKGDGPRTWKAPDCNYPVSKDSDAEYYAQGVTQGWKDVYEWYLPHQYVDVTGLPDGTYVLETIADPENRFLEADESNNCGSVYVKLTDMSSPRPTARILADGPSCKEIQKAFR